MKGYAKSISSSRMKCRLWKPGKQRAKIRPSKWSWPTNRMWTSWIRSFRGISICSLGRYRSKTIRRILMLGISILCRMILIVKTYNNNLCSTFHNSHNNPTAGTTQIQIITRSSTAKHTRKWGHRKSSRLYISILMTKTNSDPSYRDKYNLMRCRSNTKDKRLKHG